MCNLLTNVYKIVCNVYRIKHNVYKIVCNVHTERISLFADGVQHNTQLKNNNTKKRVIKICQSLRDRLFFLRSFFYREASLISKASSLADVSLQSYKNQLFIANFFVDFLNYG